MQHSFIDLEKYFDLLWPICRSITGQGVRQSIEILKEVIPLEMHEVKTGTQAFDWQVPREWNVDDAYITDMDGNRLIDFKENNLHLMSYSIPIKRTMTWLELEPHLYFDANLAQAIPYRTSYYKDNWGFCLSKNQYDKISKNDEFQVFIDTSLSDGVLNYADLVLPGDSSEEIFFSSYICHPSMANNEISGPLLLAAIYQYVKKLPNRKYTYRFLLAPETIGAICYLSEYGENLKENMKAGYILTCVGLDQPVTYKRSRQLTAYNDRVFEYVLKNEELNSLPYEILDFSPFGSDERQYCSSGFNLPVGSAVRGMYGKYPEYHTSLDNKDLLSFQAIHEMVDLYSKVVDIIENDIFYISEYPYCEPQLGKRGVYPTTGGEKHNQYVHAMLWLLNLSDGHNSERDIISKSGLDKEIIKVTASKLLEKGLLKKVNHKV